MDDSTISVDLLIIGGGPAGMAAALSAWDAGCRKMLILERDDRLGGILPQCIHNGFGLHRFQVELTGPEYARRDILSVLERQIPFQCGTMVLELARDRRVTAVSPDRGVQHFQAGAVILAMGCRERPRGALGIPGTRCSGIMTTGTAQRLVNLEGYMPGRRVIILGSGDIGLIMARRMTFEGAKVLACVEIMPYSSGLTRNVVQCLQDYNIPLLLNHTVIDIHGEERLTGVTLAAVDPDTRQILPETAESIACDTLLLSVGLIPENELSRQAGVTLSGITQGPVVDQNLATDIPGIFACGNVLHVHDLVDEVSAEADRAGKAAVAWLAGLQPEPGKKPAQKEPLAAVAVPILDGAGVRGVVPQYYLRPSGQDCEADGKPVRLSFRPDAVYRRTAVRIEADGKPVARF
ncbi:MAG TPA: pyridine nucleotide-disulfide oxidoreductase, partial [Clostridiales bacterium]|nr:pyridine nucleotide-disulfide oxidoreductase [Clostridiales bacterium]